MRELWTFLLDGVRPRKENKKREALVWFPFQIIRVTRVLPDAFLLTGLGGWGAGGLRNPNVLSKLPMTFPFTTIRIKYGTQTGFENLKQANVGEAP